MTRDYHKHNQVVISVVSDVASSFEQAVFYHSLKFIHLYFFQYFFFPIIFLLWNSHVLPFDSVPQITELVVNFFFSLSLWMISTGLSLSS